MLVIINGMGALNKSIITRKTKQEKNFERTTSEDRTGKVISTSTVPLLFSSAHSDIVTAGRTNIKIMGSIPKKDLIDDCPSRKKVCMNSHPAIIKKTVITTYPSGELKYEFNSFFKMVVILFIAFG